MWSISSGREDNYDHKLLVLGWLNLVLFEPSYSVQTNATTKKLGFPRHKSKEYDWNFVRSQYFHITGRIGPHLNALIFICNTPRKFDFFYLHWSELKNWLMWRMRPSLRSEKKYKYPHTQGRVFSIWQGWASAQHRYSYVKQRQTYAPVFKVSFHNGPRLCWFSNLLNVLS